MAHHRRKKKKSSRAGCSCCKPWKDNENKGSYNAQTNQEKKARDAEQDGLDYVLHHPAPKGNLNNICEKCKVPSERDEHFDSYYCPVCYEWLEKRCDNPDCEFCFDRPEKAIII